MTTVRNTLHALMLLALAALLAPFVTPVLLAQLPTQTTGDLVTQTIWNNTINAINTNTTGLATLNAAAVIVLDRDVTVATNSGSSETTGYSFSVPANTLGSTHGLRLTAQADILDGGGGNNFTFRLKYGGTTGGVVQFTTPGGAETLRRAVLLTGILSAQNATNSQDATLAMQVGDDVGNAGTSLYSDAGQTVGHHEALTIDSTASQTILLSVQQSSASGSVVTRIKTVRLLYEP